jgi:hypothetical protein
MVHTDLTSGLMSRLGCNVRRNSLGNESRLAGLRYADPAMNSQTKGPGYGNENEISYTVTYSTSAYDCKSPPSHLRSRIHLQTHAARHVGGGDR